VGRPAVWLEFANVGVMCRVRFCGVLWSMTTIVTCAYRASNSTYDKRANERTDTSGDHHSKPMKQTIENYSCTVQNYSFVVII